jgi:threonine synthase
VTAHTPVISLGEGSTPLLPARRLSELLGVEILLKWEASNPDRLVQGSRHDGRSVEGCRGRAEAVICASTGNTAASAAAYAGAEPGFPPSC